MTIKPAGKVAIVVAVVVGGFFLLKPLINKKPEQVNTEVKADSVAPVIDTQAVVVPTEIPKNLSRQPVKKPVAPVKKEVKKETPKKKKERENLDIEF